MAASTYSYLATVAESCERYEDMSNYMVCVAKEKQGNLSFEERMLFERAFRGVILPRRTAYQRLVGAAPEVDSLRARVAEEVVYVASYVVKLVHSLLLPASRTSGDIIANMKLVADYQRYMVEVGVKLHASVEKMYGEAVEMAKVHLPLDHPLRLALTINYGVFMSESLGRKEDAVMLFHEPLNLPTEGWDSQSVALVDMMQSLSLTWMDDQ